ncbi:uncharacterized protein LOC117115595 [Anneissia japonica]|uniref:uncharacterized protein LOC117115595 n=1 Tax=Anneissia japonica TaxID=1529436 RepID=UPI00142564C1|nr:uncharacterized protein LOC117115595 [Anneissia japonica]
MSEVPNIHYMSAQFFQLLIKNWLTHIHYSKKYSNQVLIDFERLNWIPEIRPSIDHLEKYTFLPIKPKDIKKRLMSKKSNSSPGPDSITYGILKKFPCCHHFLATLFSKINESCIPPSSWTTCNVIPIYKNGESNDPANCRMIALSSSIGKLYHQILSGNLENYLIKNNIINSDLQKAFIKGNS